MKKYLISLTKDIQRREIFFRQTDAQDFQVLDAINTMHESPENLITIFDSEKFKKRYARPVTKGEIGCTLSHLAVFRLIKNDENIKNNEYCLICEDDAFFNEDFQYHVDCLIRQVEYTERITEKKYAEIILLGQSKIASFDDIELELTYPTTFSFLQKKILGSSFKYSYTYKPYFAGTVAYLIKKSAVDIFLEKAIERPFWLADDYLLFKKEFKLDICNVRPLLAIENPNLQSNLEDFRGSLEHKLWRKLLKYPFKKLLAIIRNLVS